MARAKEIRGLVIDEVSLVDKGANQHAKTVIAKRHDVEEETTVEKYYNEDGDLIDLADLQDGAHVWDEKGQEFEYSAAEDVEDDESDDETEDAIVEDAELVGKSSVFAKTKEETKVTKSMVEEVREELSKALTDKDRDDVIAKALGKVEELETIAKRAEKAAADERNLRLEREYTDIAKSYNVPVKPEDLGRVLKRLAEVLDTKDQLVIKRCLDATAASQDLFEEYGNRGGGDNADILSQVDALVDGRVSKTDLTREDTISKVFEENPDAYDTYLAERRA